jgi:chromosome segregation protein
LNPEDMESDKNRKVELEAGITDADKRLLNLSGDIKRYLILLTRIKQDKEKLRFEIGKIRDPKIIAEITTYTQRMEKINLDLNNLNSRIRENELRIKEVHGKEAESIHQILCQIEKEKKGFEEEANEKNNQLKELNAVLKEKEKKAEEFYSKYKELFKLRNKLSDEIRVIETKIVNLNEKVRDIEYKLNGLSLDKATFNAQLAGLKEEFEPFRDIDRVENKSILQLKHTIDDFEKMIIEMGNVNMKALEIYDGVKEEYDNLINKRENLLREKDEVIKMMNEIESKKQELFMKTFTVLEKNFSTFFSKLSSKGEAHLVLENPVKPMEGGVLIKVRLTSKRFVDIRSLSGGEKTLTVLALMFAIQEFEPATFYIFDEVEAALDKNNSEKLARLIEEYSRKAQYIVISHNDYIIQSGDTLFGISMNEEGISKIISLKV